MFADRIGQHEVLLPVNHNCNKIWDILGFLKEIPTVFLLTVKKAIQVHVCDCVYCPVTLSCWR